MNRRLATYTNSFVNFAKASPIITAAGVGTVGGFSISTTLATIQAMHNHPPQNAFEYVLKGTWYGCYGFAVTTMMAKGIFAKPPQP